jgi:hypothetical protein
MNKCEKIISLRKAGYLWHEIAAMCDTTENYARDCVKGKVQSSNTFGTHRCPECRALITTRECIKCGLKNVRVA